MDSMMTWLRNVRLAMAAPLPDNYSDLNTEVHKCKVTFPIKHKMLTQSLPVFSPNFFVKLWHLNIIPVQMMVCWLRPGSQMTM